jgi:hypothetical protein
VSICLILALTSLILPSAGRATTSYLRNATLGAQAIAVVTKMWISHSILSVIVDLSSSTDGRYGTGSTKKYWPSPQYLLHELMISLLSQLYLYGHPRYLRPLQGLCVPNIIGVFSTSEGLANMAMEPPHPHAWRVAERSISVDEKDAIVEAYAQIHARGVLHGDVALRHMLIGMFMFRLQLSFLSQGLKQAGTENRQLSTSGRLLAFNPPCKLASVAAVLMNFNSRCAKSSFFLITMARASLNIDSRGSGTL